MSICFVRLWNQLLSKTAWIRSGGDGTSQSMHGSGPGSAVPWPTLPTLARAPKQNRGRDEALENRRSKGLVWSKLGMSVIAGRL